MTTREAIRSFVLRTGAGLLLFGGVGLAAGLGRPDPLAGFARVASSTAPAAMTWKLDPVHCMALFRIHHVGAGQFWGMFDGVTGTISWPENGDEVPVFDVSVDVESVHTGTEKLDRTIMSPQFFNAKEFETVSFKSTGGERTGEGTWNVTGDFTMHGVTKPVTAAVELTGVVGNPVQKKAGFEALFTLKRSDFDMNWGVKNKALGDEVRMVVGLEGDWVK
ncbi:MAG: YceI family protein [Planctomycetota bacterium]|nr:YceI family protein [Planctomycetota bacterium]